MVGINYVRVNPTSEYLDLSFYTPLDFNLQALQVKADNEEYKSYNSKLKSDVSTTGYSKEQVLRIPLSDISSTKHLFFVRFITSFAGNNNDDCKPPAYKSNNITNVAVADTKFVYDAKLKLVTKDALNPTCFNAYINDIVRIGWIEEMFNQSVRYEQFDRASYWMSQLEKEVEFINNNN